VTEKAQDVAKREIRILDCLRSSRRGLLVQLAGLGDLIMALPAIESLRAHLPHVRWTLVTRPENSGLLHGRVEEIRAMPWPPTVQNAGLIVKQVLWLRRERYDVAVHLYAIGSVRGALGIKALFLGMRPALSIGRRGPDGPRLFDINWDERQATSRHEVDLNLGLAASLGAPCATRAPSLAPSGEAVRHVTTMVQQRFVDAKRFVALFPGGTLPEKHWPVARYSELAGRLSRQGFGVCVIGGKAEVEDAQQIAEAAGTNGSNLAGSLSLPDLVALLSMASAYVGNDSGPTHVAAAVGIPCVALFGPVDVERFRPRGSGPIRVLRSEAECVPCRLAIVGHHTCMGALSLEAVWEAVLEIIMRAPAASRI